MIHSNMRLLLTSCSLSIIKKSTVVPITSAHKLGHKYIPIHTNENKKQLEIELHQDHKENKFHSFVNEENKTRALIPNSI